jgi:PAS domain S-box-containing protein
MASSARDRFMSFFQSGACKVAVIYLMIGLSWIFFSDRVAFEISGGSPEFLQFEVLKGFGFIIVTSILLYGLIRYFSSASEKQQQLLLRYESRYRKLYESMWDAFATVDMAGWIKEYNPAFREMLGYSDEELTNLTYRDITPEKWHVAEDKILNEQVLLLGRSEVYEKEYRRKDGTIIPVELHTFLIRDDTGQPAGMGAIVRDITMRKRAEGALRESEARYRTLVENIPEKIFVKDTALAYVSCNEHYARDLGIAPGSIAGKTDFDFYPGDLAEKYRADDRAVMDSGKIRLIEERYVAGGKEFRISTIKTPLRNEAGEVSGILGIFHDITDRKMAQDALCRATKKLSFLNSIIFSDIQNAVFSLAGYFELEKDNAPDEKMRHLDNEIRIIRTITESLKFASNYQNLGLKPPTWQNVNQVFLFGISHLDISKISRKLDIGGLEIYADPLLENVFFSLTENAILHGKTATEIALHYHESPEGLTIFFEDNGEGIPPGLKETIFDKRSEGRKGMGLFLAREILSITGITMKETGEPGKGARFEIVVPGGRYRFVSVQ